VSPGGIPFLGKGAVIGLPRALLHYELYPFWRALFETLDLEVAVSAPTSRDLIESGAKRAVDEACLPVKAYYGHVMALRDKVDAVFMPRVVSLHRGTYTCPKLLGLPDMIRHNVGRLPPAIVADFDETKRGRGLGETGVALGRRLGKSGRQAREAVAAGFEALNAFRRALWAGVSFEEAAALAARGEGVPTADWRDVTTPNGHPRVALVGHAYNIFDPGVNLDLVRKLRGLGCRVVTSEMLSDEEVRVESEAMPKEIFWSSGRRIMAAVKRFRRDGLVDGMIHITSFACGPDSMVGEIAERETRRESALPYMALTIDEHTAEAGLVTRLEAFADMLWRRRRKTGGTYR
jgi:predicted nucleotide-binding protein (sugar kinase/HSP70/actin superfamily)